MSKEIPLKIPVKKVMIGLDDQFNNNVRQFSSNQYIKGPMDRNTLNPPFQKAMSFKTSRKNGHKLQNKLTAP